VTKRQLQDALAGAYSQLSTVYNYLADVDESDEADPYNDTVKAIGYEALAAHYRTED
jgi:hypothetical protein